MPGSSFRLDRKIASSFKLSDTGSLTSPVLMICWWLAGVSGYVHYELWLFQGYLHAGYYGKRFNDMLHTPTWTMPHCVLALRLTGAVLDVWDGRKKFVSNC